MWCRGLATPALCLLLLAGTALAAKRDGNIDEDVRHTHCDGDCDGDGDGDREYVPMEPVRVQWGAYAQANNWHEDGDNDDAELQECRQYLGSLTNITAPIFSAIAPELVKAISGDSNDNNEVELVMDTQNKTLTQAYNQFVSAVSDNGGTVQAVPAGTDLSKTNSQYLKDVLADGRVDDKTLDECKAAYHLFMNVTDFLVEWLGESLSNATNDAVASKVTAKATLRDLMPLYTAIGVWSGFDGDTYGDANLASAVNKVVQTSEANAAKVAQAAQANAADIPQVAQANAAKVAQAAQANAANIPHVAQANAANVAQAAQANAANVPHVAQANAANVAQAAQANAANIAQAAQANAALAAQSEQVPY